MRAVGFVASAVLLGAAPLAAAPLFSDTFDGENGGVSAAAYDGFANFDSFGTVNLVRGSDVAGTCSGSCVALDSGTEFGGFIVSKESYSFEAGDTVRLTFDLGGSQQPGDFEFWSAGFDFGSASVSLSNYGSNFFGTDNNSGPTHTFNFAFGDIIGGQTALATRSVFFTAAEAGSFKFSVSAQSYDGNGPLVDNITLSNSGVAAVPEPASWALMIAGFAMTGYRLRRRAMLAA